MRFTIKPTANMCLLTTCRRRNTGGQQAPSVSNKLGNTDCGEEGGCECEKNRLYWTDKYLKLRKMNWETVSYVVTAITFLYTIGRDLLIWIVSLFTPYKSNPKLYMDNKNLKILLSIPIENKNEFTIRTQPKIELIEADKLCGILYNKVSVDKREFGFDSTKSDLGENKKLLLFQYEFYLTTYLNFKIKKNLYIKTSFEIVNVDKPLIFYYSLDTLLKYRKSEFLQFSNSVLENNNKLNSYKSNLTLSERQKLFVQDPNTSFKLERDIDEDDIDSSQIDLDKITDKLETKQQ